MSEDDCVIGFARERKDVERCHEAMKGLWPELKRDYFVSEVVRRLDKGYQLAFLEFGGEVKSVIGFRISVCFSRGKALYVEDFSTKPSEQSNGFGNRLFDWTRRHAIEQGCDWLHLDCQVQNFKGVQFYSKKGMDITSYHFGMSLK